jgi:alpha-1,2-mannosyltransferase
MMLNPSTRDSDPAQLRPGRRVVVAIASSLLAAVAIAGVWWLAFWIEGAAHFYDLRSYRDTLNGVVAGDLMYKWLGYPPVSLVVLSPLRGLPELAGDRLWTGASLLVVVGIATVIAGLSMRAKGEQPDRDKPRWIALTGFATTVLLLSQPGLTQLVNGQLTLFVIALAFVDASGFLPRKWQGTLVGLAAALKLTPLIFFPYYVITKQWRQLGLASASFGLFTAIGFGLFPADSVYFWTHANSSDRLGPQNPENLTIYGLLNRWLTNPTAIQILWLVLAGAVAVLAYWRARQHYRRGEVAQAALIIGCASTSVGPIAWPHYLIWVVLAAIWLLYLGERRWFWTGVALYLLYSPAFAAVVGVGMAGGNTLAAAASELQVLAPIAIIACGLPRQRPAAPGSAGPARESVRAVEAAG